MGRSDYLVQAGVGFDVDRSGARKSIGVFESLANTLNTVATKTAAKGFEKTEKDYAATMKHIKQTSEKADEDLRKGTKASAEATRKALQRSMPKPLTAAQKKQKRSDGTLAEHNKKFKKSLQSMKTSYSKYVKEAAKLGIKVQKSEKGFGAGKTVTDFKNKDLEQRKQLINLNKRMIKDNEARLKGMDKKHHMLKSLKRETENLKRQEEAMVNLNEDLTQQERKNAKIKQKAAKDERKAEKRRAKDQKKQIARLKAIGQGFQRIGQVASMTAGKIKAGMQNAFVIGTAAAAAFFYKMQPLAETVMEFEKTIINANSVFNVTSKELHSVSDSMVRFTMKYGVSAQETATGLYQLASAGLSAAESQEVLQHTMKLAMATQGDHNTLAKLTVQTIMGFGMEMEEAGELTDKFAHTIQKSLVEWQDLASSVKFAMPFFVATGQSVDQLLGGLEVLSNRALEAGIAGRGLRQALAQFAKHADDNESAFAKMGISIMDTEGNMKALSDIALEAKAAFGDVTDLEALTAMLEDMNVRGATAFALLVQNAGEFDAAVKDISTSAGEATQMADIQQQSLEMQIQRVKNALLAPFLLSDPIGEANGTLNEFTLRIKELVDEFTKFFIIIGPDGQETYTQHGEELKKGVIAVLNEAMEVIRRLKDVFLEQGSGIETFTELLHYAVMPLHLMLDILDYLGPSALKWYTAWKAITMLLPISNLLTIAATAAQTRLQYAMATGIKLHKISYLSMMKDTFGYGANTAAVAANTMTIQWSAMYKSKESYARAGNLVNVMRETVTVNANTAANYLNAKSIAMMGGKLLIFIGIAAAMTKVMGGLGLAVASLAAVYYMGGITKMFDWYALMMPPPAAVAMTAATAAVAMGAIWAGYNAFVNRSAAEGIGAVPEAPDMKFNKERNYDGGGTYLPVMEGGGMSTEHGMAVLQKGETVVPKTQNMLGGGITLNMGDVSVQDGEDFAERVASALPDALRRVNEQGAI